MLEVGTCDLKGSLVLRYTKTVTLSNQWEILLRVPNDDVAGSVLKSEKVINNMIEKLLVNVMIER